MDVAAFLEKANYKQIIDKISELSCEDSIESLDLLTDFLLIKDFEIYGKSMIPRLASRALIKHGEKGIERMVHSFYVVQSLIYKTAIFESLWYATQGKLPDCPIPLSNKMPPALESDINYEIIEITKREIRKISIESRSDSDKFYYFLSIMYNVLNKVYSNNNEIENFKEDFFNLITESTIGITKNAIDEFEKLVFNELTEEAYQIFLSKNPVFLNPLGKKIIDKHRLGSDYITDFVLETYEKDYVIVEIEKPQDNIFTRNGEFSSKFIHAYGQVIDFINWLENNISYAKEKLPGLTSPKGLLIMGRSSKFTERDWLRFKRFNRNSNSIELITYDEVLENSKRLYKNLID